MAFLDRVKKVSNSPAKLDKFTESTKQNQEKLRLSFLIAFALFFPFLFVVKENSRIFANGNHKKNNDEYSNSYQPA